MLRDGRTDRRSTEEGEGEGVGVERGKKNSHRKRGSGRNVCIRECAPTTIYPGELSAAIARETRHLGYTSRWHIKITIK